MWIRQTHQCNIFGNSWCNDGFQQNVILQSINHWGEGGGCSWCWVSTRALVILSTTSSYICMYLCVCICIGPYCILYLHICICTWKRCRLLVLMGTQVQVHSSGESSQPSFCVRAPACQVVGASTIGQLGHALWESRCSVVMMESLEREYRLKIPEKWINNHGRNLWGRPHADFQHHTSCYPWVSR